MYLKVHVTHGSLDFLKYRTWSVSNSILIISVWFFLFSDICEISQRWVERRKLPLTDVEQGWLLVLEDNHIQSLMNELLVIH